MPQLKIQDGVGLLDAEFNGSFVLQCMSCQHKRVQALGPHTIPFPLCALCAGGDCALRQREGVVFVNLIDRGNQIVGPPTVVCRRSLRFGLQPLHECTKFLTRCSQILSPFGHRSSIPGHTADCVPLSSCVHRLQANMMKQNIVMEGRGAIATVTSQVFMILFR